MAKFKPVKPKRKAMQAPQGAVGCVILVLAGMILVMIFLYFSMKNPG